MSAEPFVGEISMVGFNFAPRGWAKCEGQLLSIAQNTALFALLGTTYGGNGHTTFALPDLRGRFPVHPGWQGRSISLGEQGGQETVSLDASQMPPHSHSQPGAGERLSDRPDGRTPARGGAYGDPVSGVVMAPGGVSGAGLAHENMPPYLGITFIIALQGIFPSRD